MLSRFHRLPERDGRTDRQNCYINIVHQCAIKTESKLIFGFGCLPRSLVFLVAFNYHGSKSAGITSITTGVKVWI